jgi:hypothetical protein
LGRGGALGDLIITEPDDPRPETGTKAKTKQKSGQERPGRNGRIRAAVSEELTDVARGDAACARGMLANVSNIAIPTSEIMFALRHNMLEGCTEVRRGVRGWSSFVLA